MLKDLFCKFNSSKYASEPPYTSSLFLMGGIGLILAYKEMFINPISFLKTSIFEDDTIPILEAQPLEKNTILFDFRNFLSYSRFSLSKFDFVNVKRFYCEEFLFYLAQYYELICISDGIPFLDNKKIKKIDPLNCISYKIFVNNKNKWKPQF